MNKVRDIIKILFKYNTANLDDGYNQGILSCQKKLSKFLKQRGVHNELQLYFPVKSKKRLKSANLVAFNPRSKGKFVLFQGHVDTVPDFDKHKIKINSRYIMGRGAVDMKGSLAGMINAFIKSYKKKEEFSPILLITGDEEAHSFSGIKDFLKKNERLIKRIAFGINGEPSGLNVQTRFRGVVAYTIRVQGVAGHSAYPQGKGLIEDMIPVITSIKKFMLRARLIKSKGFGNSVGVFTVLRSGIKENQLPKDFQASFNLRTVKQGKFYSRLFDDIVKPELPPDTAIESFSFDPLIADIPEKYLVAVKEAFKKVHMSYKKSSSRFFTEATLLNRAGVPTLVLGPGEPRLAHIDSKLEKIGLKAINNYSGILTNIMHELNSQIL
jgi:acetylornithine deacetylase/succinyl-diaminopimelate desuccinylase-like protein